MSRGRTFTREFKLELMHQLASGQRRPAQVCREHELANGVLWRWRREYAERGEAAFDPGQLSEQQALERRLAELERLRDQLALENAVLKAIHRKRRGSAASRGGER